MESLIRPMPSMFDTDNDGLEDGEEIALGLDQYITHANNSDTDNDTLSDGNEVLYVPRPWQPVQPIHWSTIQMVTACA